MDTETSTEYSDTKLDVEPSTELKHLGLWDPLGAEGQETIPVRESSSSSPDEALTGSSPTPVMKDSRAYQELLHRVAQNMGLQVEEVSEGMDPTTDVLALMGLARVALPLIKTIQSTGKALWQTPTSLPPTAKKVAGKYFVPSKTKDYEYIYIHPLRSLGLQQLTSVRGKDGKAPCSG